MSQVQTFALVSRGKLKQCVKMKKHDCVSVQEAKESYHDLSVRASIGYTCAPSSDKALNGVSVGVTNFPLNLSTFHAQHGSLPPPAVPEGTVWENEVAQVEVYIRDARQSAACLVSHGYELMTGVNMCPANAFDISQYLRDVERLALELTDASTAVAYCHAARAPKRPSLCNAATRAGYATYVHTDQAHHSWTARLCDIVEDWALVGPPGVNSEVAKRAAAAQRYAVLSAWRYLGPEQKCRSSHLAIVEPTSLRPEDVLHFEIRAPNGTFGSNYRLNKSAYMNHEWCYFPNMDKDDELLFFTVYDSNPSFANYEATVAPTVFHSAFYDPRHLDSPDRESIDVRVLLVWDSA